MGKHKLRTYKIGYGTFVWYGQIYFNRGFWLVNTTDKGTRPAFEAPK